MPVPSHHARPRSRWSRLTAGFAAVATLVLATVLVGPASSASAAVSLTPVANFGSNPGGLNMYVYKPTVLPDNAPVVLALHGCTQNARTYADNSGLPAMADRDGFVLVLAETTSSNNLNKCFNWFQPGDVRRDQGEALSIKQMADHAVSSYGGDAEKVFVTGLSAGGAMTSAVLAAYPDVFSAGAIVAGLPSGCAKDVLSAYSCMNPGVDKSPSEWARLVRDANSSYSGPWPRVAIWYGDKDTTVAPRNGTELRDQWTELHGVGQTPTSTASIGPNATRQDSYATSDGTVAVEVDKVPGINHGTPVDPGTGAEQCGSTGAPYFLDSICSSHWISKFFGLGA